MLIVHVFVHVLADKVEEFARASAENARHSIEEAGVVRFDVIASLEDPTRFVLVEVYRTPEDALAHKQTAHYATWRDAVADLMAEPRTSEKYAPVFPAAANWG